MSLGLAQGTEQDHLKKEKKEKDKGEKKEKQGKSRAQPLLPKWRAVPPTPFLQN